MIGNADLIEETVQLANARVDLLREVTGVHRGGYDERRGAYPRPKLAESRFVSDEKNVEIRQRKPALGAWAGR